jgi:quercetin dioxygenase-like cupin family protein
MPQSTRLFPALLLNRPCHPQVVAYYFKQWQGFHMPFHRHDATEIMYTIQGFCEIEIQLCPTRTERVRLKKGEFILLNANIAHRLIVEDDEPCRMLNVEFRFTQHQGVMPIYSTACRGRETTELFIGSSDLYLVLRDPDEVYHVMKSLVLELDKAG